MNWNTITARFFNWSTRVERADPAGDGQRIQVERMGTIYPGGFGACSLVIQRDPVRPLPFRGGDLVRLYNGPRMVWEGFVTGSAHFVGDNSHGVRVQAVGGWGWLLATRSIDKRWADNRMTNEAWYEDPTAYSPNDQTLSQIETIDRVDGRLRFTPKNVAFTNQWYHRLRYSMPTGQTVKRFKLSYDMQEAAQAWSLELFNEQSVAAVWTVTASATGTRDDTLVTPTQHMFILFRSAAGQTPATDGTIYGQVDDAISGATGFMVYSETGNINAYEVFKDVAALVSELSTDTSAIDASLTVSVEPFITNGREAYSSILARIAGYGTSSYGAIGYGIRGSDQASDRKPMLFAEPWPALTDYEYEISMRNVQGGLSVVRDFAGIANWITVQYEDALGVTHIVTPDDDANLKDTASITAYGERHLSRPLSLGQIGETAAKQYARRYLASSKDPQVYVSGSIRLAGYVPGKNGTKVPAANVVAGERAKIVDFISDVINVAGAGLTAVITFAEYSDENGGTVSLSFGVPDNLAIMLARAGLPKVIDTKPGPRVD